MLENQTKKKTIHKFMICFILMSFAAFLTYYDEKLESYNSTVLAFSYKYGFISRGLIGSLYQLADKIVPGNMIDYDVALYVTLGITIAFYIFFFWFCKRCLQYCREEHLKSMMYIIIFLAIFVIPTYASKRNLGRLDLYMFVFCMIGALLILKEKAEWLIVPLSALGVMVHQGFVFMYFNILLVLLLYQVLSTEGAKRKKYIAILVCSFVVASALFLWFQLFSHFDGSKIYNDIVKNAKALSYKGKYHDTLIDAEILGVDLTKTEWPFHVMNWIELPFYLVFISPYIYLGVKLFQGIQKKTTTKIEKWKYFFVAAGPLTILPNFILKVDYARWFLAILCYYAVVLMTLMAMGDEIVTGEITGLIQRMREKYTWSMILLLYPILFSPFWDVHICSLMRNISNPINETFLHLW